VSVKGSLNVSDSGIKFSDDKTITQTLGIKYIIVTGGFVSITGNVGDVKLHAGSTIPANHLACDGASYVITAYQDLYGVIGITYGTGDNPRSTFNVPDLRNAVPIHQE
jgi:hypothetical protein